MAEEEDDGEKIKRIYLKWVKNKNKNERLLRYVGKKNGS